MLRNNVDLAHADMSDEEFSFFWTGYRDYIVREEYPEWIDLCRRVASAFDGGHFQTVPNELAIKFGLAKESKIIDTHNSLYRQEFDIGADRQDDKPKGDLEKLKGERELWSLKSIRKLIIQYMSMRMAESKNKDEILDFNEMKNKLVNEFARLLVENVINPVCDKFQLNAYRVTQDQFDLFSKEIDSFLILLLSHSNNDKYICAMAETGTPPLPERTPSPCSSEQDCSESDTVDPIHEEVSGSLPAASPVHQTKSTFNKTPLLVALGAIAGVVALGVVIAATHGIAVPFIAGVGIGILAGHGGVAAGLAVGCSLFGIAAATVGAGITYAAKKTYDFVNWCCCRQQSASDIRDSHDHIGHTQVGRSPSTTSLLAAAMGDEQHDYKSTQSSREGEVAPLLSVNDSPRDNVPVSSRFSWASLFCCMGDATQRQSLASEQWHHQTPDRRF